MATIIFDEQTCGHNTIMGTITSAHQNLVLKLIHNAMPNELVVFNGSYFFYKKGSLVVFVIITYEL